jgi:hypothetical protein
MSRFRLLIEGNQVKVWCQRCQSKGYGNDWNYTVSISMLSLKDPPNILSVCRHGHTEAPLDDYKELIKQVAAACTSAAEIAWNEDLRARLLRASGHNPGS